VGSIVRARFLRWLRRALPPAVRRELKRPLQALGYDLVQEAPVDFRGLPLATPLDAIERSGGRRAIVDVPVARIRSMDVMGFACTPDAPNPFVRTAQGLIDGSVTAFMGSPLDVYYRAFRPVTIRDLFGLPATAASPALRQCPLNAALPWQDAPGPHRRQTRTDVTARDEEGYDEGLGPADPSDASWCEWGPVTPRRGAIEVRRLAAVVTSIRKAGYRPDAPEHEHVTGHLLVGDARDDWAVSIDSGHHRIAALAALGYATVPILIEPRGVRRAAAENWAGVRSGAFAASQARAIFDMVLVGRRDPWPGAVLEAPEIGGSGTSRLRPSAGGPARSAGRKRAFAS
jgi:hypothetical protein